MIPGPSTSITTLGLHKARLLVERGASQQVRLCLPPAGRILPHFAQERCNARSTTNSVLAAQQRSLILSTINRFTTCCAFLHGLPAIIAPNLVLARASILLKTQLSYSESLVLFVTYLENTGVSLESAEDLDYTLAHFGQKYCFDGGQKSLYGNMISAVAKFFPHLRKRLSAAWGVFGGWTTLNPSKQRLPIPEPAMLAMVEELCLRKKFRAAAMVWTGFHTFMRKEELADVTAKEYIQFRVPTKLRADSLDSTYGVIRIEETKKGLVQSVTITDFGLHSLLVILCAKTSANSRLFVSGASLQSHMAQSAKLLGFSTFNFTPHSLRHGGATAAILNGLSVDSVKLRGRWNDLATVLRYVQSGVVAKICESLPLAVHLRADVLRVIGLFPSFGAMSAAA